jgi:CRISPR-associated protein Cas2
MDLLVTYDIDTTTREGERRLRRVARACERIGARVQKSVFEVICSETELVKIMHQLASLIEVTSDSVRFYQMPAGAFGEATHIGAALRPGHRGDFVI